VGITLGAQEREAVTSPASMAFSELKGYEAWHLQKGAMVAGIYEPRAEVKGVGALSDSEVVLFQTRSMCREGSSRTMKK